MTEVPGLTPTFPVTVDTPALVAVEPLITPKLAAVPRLTGIGEADAPAANGPSEASAATATAVAPVIPRRDIRLAR